MTIWTLENKETSIERFFWVDVLRGIAAFAIVIFHYHHFYLANNLDRSSIPNVNAFPYASILAPIYGHWAAHAVELFWMISGFVFAHVYLRRRATAWEFGAARFARLYPLHFATLLYVAAMQWLSFKHAGHWQIYGNNDPWHFLLQMLMSSNWSNVSYGLSFNGPIWSVSLEILIYCLFFVALFAVRSAPLITSSILSAFCWAWFVFEPFILPLVSIKVFECGGYFFLGGIVYSIRPYAGV